MAGKRIGFTLVELSIVLVIVGLLIGGILVAQSLMESAKINAQVRQFQQFDIAVSTFKQKFGALPGDSSLIPGSLGVPVGNQDGILDSNSIYHPMYEFTQFWPELASTGMLGAGVSYAGGCNPCTIQPGVQLPIAKLPKMQLHPLDGGAGPLGIIAYSIGSTNYYGITQAVAQNGLGWGYAITPATMVALDAKMDDGNGISGKVTAKIRNGNLQDPLTDAGGACINASGKYLVNNVYGYHYGCIPRIEMLSTGEQQ